MRKTPLAWDILLLRKHLQWAADLELWTIPYYLTVLHSIRDRSSLTYQLVQSVAYQEMLHVQSIANIANAFGAKLQFNFKKYKRGPYNGTALPHLNFKLDSPNPTDVFAPYTAELGSLDLMRINSMCLVEYPVWKTGHRPNAREDISEYGSVGEFYQAIEVGAKELVGHLTGGINQVDMFRHFYTGIKQTTVDADGELGLRQVSGLVESTLTQGEGARSEGQIPAQFVNTADDIRPDWQHYKKFMSIRDLILAGQGPQTYTGIADPKPGSKGRNAQQILCATMDSFFEDINQLFSSGALPDSFGPNMAKVGANILYCWQQGAIPKFSR